MNSGSTTCKHIDVVFSSPWAEQLAEEILDSNNDSSIAYRNNRRWTLDFQRIDTPDETPELTIYLTLRWSALMLVVGLLVAGVMALFAADITELLFERGEFNAEDTAIVTAVFQYAMIQVPLYFCAMVMVSALLAKSKFSYVAAIGAILFLTKLLLAYQLAPVMELRGLMIATAGVYAVSCILCWLALLKTEYQRDDGTR